MTEERLETKHGRIPLLQDGPSRAATTVILAPGAGADMRHPFMDTVAGGLARKGHSVVRFNFPYQERGRKSPDKQPVLEDICNAVLDRFGTAETMIAGGKSMGGRIASHVVAAGARADGLLFLGYPLHPPGRPDRMRDAHLRDIKIPMLFIEGTRDPFCPLETLDHVRRELHESEVAIIDDGDHSFKVRKSSGRTTEAAWHEVVDHAARWIERR